MTVAATSDAPTPTKDRYILRLLHFRIANDYLQVEEVPENAIHDIRLLIASPALNRPPSPLTFCLEKLDELDEPIDIPFFALREGETAHRFCILCMVRPHLFPTRRLAKKHSYRIFYPSLPPGSLDLKGSRIWELEECRALSIPCFAALSD